MCINVHSGNCISTRAKANMYSGHTNMSGERKQSAVKKENQKENNSPPGLVDLKTWQ